MNDRDYFRRIGFALFALILLALFSCVALADEVHRIRGDDGKDVVVLILRDGPCVDKQVLEYLHEHVLDDRRFKKADLEWEGVAFGACWLDLDGLVMPIGSDKRPIRPIPREAFVEETI